MERASDVTIICFGSKSYQYYVNMTHCYDTRREPLKKLKYKRRI